MKTSFTRPSHLLTFPLLVGTLVLASQTCVWAGHHGSGAGSALVPTQRRITYRPAFGGAGAKTFFLNNYAGANYPPLLGGERIVPTASEQTVITRPYRPFFGRFGGVR